jgi:hypothetical protein
MEVLTKTTQDSPVLLSNAEVMELLGKKIQARDEHQAKQYRRRDSPKFAHRDWIEKYVHTYLQSTPCAGMSTKKVGELKSKLMATIKKQQIITRKVGVVDSMDVDCTTAENGDTPLSTPSTTITTTTTGFGLTEAESIQLLNFMPKEPVEIHLMIEELHGRMSEKRQAELLKLIGSYANEGEKGTIVVEEGEDIILMETEIVVKQEI